MGTFFSVQLAAKQMVKQKTPGSIVMIASIAAHHAVPSQHLAGYSCSKGAVKALMQQLAVELAPMQIRVNSISPGWVTLRICSVTLEWIWLTGTERQVYLYGYDGGPRRAVP